MTMTAEYISKAITVQAPEGQPPESLLAIARYLADDWRIADTERNGGALTVHLVKPAPPPAPEHREGVS